MLALSVIALANVARGEMRISDTYVAHGPNLATMLQVTQTDNGQITGVYSFVEVSADGRLDSEHISVTGVIDGGQLTLTLHRGLLETTNFAGNLNGNAIQLQQVGSKGDVLSWVFMRGSLAEFKTYADQVKSKAEGIA